MVVVLNAYAIAVHGWGRSSDFDPQVDSSVRTAARRLRRTLEHYYLTEGAKDPLHIEIPTGSYVPRFRQQIITATQTLSTSRSSVLSVAAHLPDGPRILVLPLSTPPSGGSEDLYLADGVTEQLVVALNQIEDFTIIGPLSRRWLTHHHYSLRELCEQYGAHFALQGALRTHPESV